jgi:hypothetical protein
VGAVFEQIPHALGDNLRARRLRVDRGADVDDDRFCVWIGHRPGL